MNGNAFSSAWMLRAILITLFCCPPIGAVGLVYGVQARKRYSASQYRIARRAVNKANQWLSLAVAGGIALWGLVGLVLLVSFA